MRNENDQHQLSVDNPDSLDMAAEDRGKLSNDHGPSSRSLPIIGLILHERYRIIKCGCLYNFA